MNKWIILVFTLCTLPLVYADDGFYARGSTATFNDFCTSFGIPCSSGLCNTTILYPNGSIAVQDAAMTGSSSLFTYNFTSTQDLGVYERYSTCCESGQCSTVQSNFEVTHTGQEQADKLAIILGLFTMVAVWICVAFLLDKEDPWQAVFKVSFGLLAALTSFLTIPAVLISDGVLFLIYSFGLRFYFILGIGTTMYLVWWCFKFVINAITGGKSG